MDRCSLDPDPESEAVEAGGSDGGFRTLEIFIYIVAAEKKIFLGKNFSGHFFTFLRLPLTGGG